MDNDDVRGSNRFSFKIYDPYLNVVPFCVRVEPCLCLFLCRDWV